MGSQSNADIRPTVLIFIATYLPGFKAGGALRTIVNTTEALSRDFQFRIVANDRDSGDTVPYPQVTPWGWQKVAQADVLYIPTGALSVAACRKLLAETPHNVLYLQSCFSAFTYKPLLARLLQGRGRRPAIVAPRGEFYEGALSIRPWKKRLYITLTRLFGLYRGIFWQASSEDEAYATRKYYGSGARIAVAPDISSPPTSTHEEGCSKKEGELRVIFLSRICPKKNLAGALRFLQEIRGTVRLDIYGPAEDTAYWESCQAIIAQLPSNILVEYRGPVQHSEVSSLFSKYNLFLFPTLGENFGHVILESLLAGCPVMISDRTPWRDLWTHRAGWELSLDSAKSFTLNLQRCVDMSKVEYEVIRRGARNFGLRYAAESRSVEATKDLLFQAAKSTTLA